MGKGMGKGGKDSAALSPALSEEVVSKYNGILGTSARVQFTINGQLYDVTGFDHPGGDTLLDVIGTDATTIFYSTHPTRVWRLLESSSFKRQYLVPRDAKVVQKTKDDEGSYEFEDEFYLECKAYVDKYLMDRRKKYGRYFDDIIVFVWTLVWLCLCVASYLNMLEQKGSVISSIMLGITWACCIFNLMHRYARIIAC